MRVAPEREVRELFRLPRGGFGQFLAAVADLHREQPGEPVEVALAGVVPEVGALAAHDHREVLGLAVPREVQPEMVGCGGALDGGDPGGFGGRGHGSSKRASKLPARTAAYRPDFSVIA